MCRYRGKNSSRCRASLLYSQRTIRENITPKGVKKYKLVSSYTTPQIVPKSFIFLLPKESICADSSDGFHTGEWHQQARKHHYAR